jgi:glycerol-3-phosphate dehydrogenase
MHRNLAALASERFDVLVIGGGILGAGIARDAALRGLRVAVIDQADFASGTSSRSSKLIHGGFRYLEQYDFRLVSESCREREILQQLAPYLVQPQPFLLPVYDGDARSLTKLRLGMTVYDLLARYRNVARHRLLSPSGTREKEPALAPGGLRGAILYYDCRADDARFCLDNLIHAAEAGAVCANYCALTGFAVRENRIAAAAVADRLSDATFEVTARVYINATGPWVEQVAGLSPFNGRQVALSPTKGVHLLLPRLTNEHAITFQSRRDGRILFVIPWGESSVVGTTDTDWRGDEPRATPEDIEYLLAEIRTLFPDRAFNAADIITTFAGVRALLRSELRNPSQRSREHLIARQGSNLISVAGGKYTTYRLIAQQAVDLAYEVLASRPDPCRTAETPLLPHRPTPAGEKIADAPEVFASDIAHACDYEMAMTVSDVMRRRTGLTLSRHGGAETASKVAMFMAKNLRWTETQMNALLRQYLVEWEQNRP